MGGRGGDSQTAAPLDEFDSTTASIVGPIIESQVAAYAQPSASLASSARAALKALHSVAAATGGRSAPVGAPGLAELHVRAIPGVKCLSGSMGFTLGRRTDGHPGRIPIPG
jgi:hypothetical protein